MSVECTFSRRRSVADADAAARYASNLACSRRVFAQTKKAIKFTLPWVAEGSRPSISILQTVRRLPTAALACCAYDATIGIGAFDDGRAVQRRRIRRGTGAPRLGALVVDPHFAFCSGGTKR